MSIEEILLGLARRIDAEAPPDHAQAIRDFTAICRRHDENPRERQRIRKIGDLIDAEDTLYAQAVAALDRGDGDLALVLLRQPAEAGIGEAPWLLASLLEQMGDTDAAIGWYQRAADDGDSRAIRKLTELADALYRVGDIAGAEQVAKRGLAHVVDPDVFVDLHWTLAQCRMQVGQFEESLATLGSALDSPELPAQHRARLLVLVARTRSNWGEVEKTGQAAAMALEAAKQTDDRWAMGWALHVLTIVTATQGRMTDALPLFEQAIAVTHTDPTLTDLRLLLQINQAVTLGNLDRYEEALAAARQAQHLADQGGSAIRLAQAHSALGQLLFNSGRWDDALTEVEIPHEDVEEPTVACGDLGIAAMIRFHRGESTVARRHLAAAEPYAKQIGKRMIGPLALARSLDHEHAGALSEALAVLTAAFADNEELGEIEDLVADAARLAAQTGDLSTMKAFADFAAALAAGSDIPRRQATALYCQGLLDHDAARLLAAAERYGDASRPLQAAVALEAAAGEFVRADDCGQAQAAFTRAEEIYTSLSATADLARLRTRFHARGIHRSPPAKPRRPSSSRHSYTLTEATINMIVEGGLPNQRIPTKLLVS